MFLQFSHFLQSVSEDWKDNIEIFLKLEERGSSYVLAEILALPVILWKIEVTDLVKEKIASANWLLITCGKNMRKKEIHIRRKMFSFLAELKGTLEGEGQLTI